MALLAALLLCVPSALAQENTDAARRLYEMGLAEEEKENYGEAARQYEQAAALGSADGMYRLAEMYYDGLTDAGKDMDRAVGYAKMAAERGGVDAMCMLAYLYCEADGVEQNYAEARLYYEQAAALGSADGMVGLGYLYEEGLGVEQNYAEARLYYDQAAALGSADGMVGLG
ncbi:MAG: sel1 repeat family protein, partial [Clostridia bacterium]|nr:sel1 repeat family protein [Clostridia bacterium]